MGGATALNHITPLLHRPPLLLLRRLRRLTTVFHSTPPSSFRLHSLHSLPSITATATTPLPWPEWSHIVHRVSPHRNEPQVDKFAVLAEMTDGFFSDATALLAFARKNPSLLWSLPREDMMVIVESISPSLFKDAARTTSRMRSFLTGGATRDPESDGPSTVDLMKFLLSYIHMTFVSSEEVYISNKVESSVRKLFSELFKSRGTSQEPVASVYTQLPESYAGMKRGDWICTRCTFLNFAKNKSCLQCEELRPKKIVIGGEWECPQCDFFNFSRNVVCLRCDCKKPEMNPLPTPATVSRQGAFVKSNTENPLAGREGEQQQWLTKITHLEKSSDLNDSITDEHFSKFMQTGHNRVFSRSSNVAFDGNPDGVNNKPSNVDMDELLARKSRVSNTSNTDGDPGGSRRDVSSFGTSNSGSSQHGSLSEVRVDLPGIMPIQTGENRFVVSKKKDRSLTSPTYKRQVAMEQAGSSNHVPFVPFPPGYFAQDNKSDSTYASPKSSDVDNGYKPSNSYDASQNTAQTSQFTSSHDGYPKTVNSSRNNFYAGSEMREKSSVEDVSWRGRSLEGSAVKETDLLDMSEEAKAERWFRRVAQIKDISELIQIPDEDFPSIMPLRKGENRFVVSKRKTPLERRLTSSQYTRNLPIANSDPDRRNMKETESS